MLILFFTNLFKFIFLIPYTLVLRLLRPPKDDCYAFGLYCFLGEFGQGKTLSMCRMALDLRLRLKVKNIDTIIYSNINTTFSKKLTSLDQIEKIAEEQTQLNKDNKPRQVIILLDEIQTVFNSRAYQSLPLNTISIICGNRHLHMLIVYTAQATFSMDKYFRELCNGFFLARKINSYLYGFYRIKNRKRVEIIEEWCKMPSPLMLASVYVVNPFDKNNLFSKYDTLEDMKDIMLNKIDDPTVNKRMGELQNINNPIDNVQLKKYKSNKSVRRL